LKITIELNYRDDTKAVATVHGHTGVTAYVTNEGPRGNFYLCDNTRRQASGKHWEMRRRHAYEVLSAWLTWVGIEADYRQDVTVIETGARGACDARIMHDAIGYGCVKTGTHDIHETALALRWVDGKPRPSNCQARYCGDCEAYVSDLASRLS
jgi:hypothetical protein